MLATLRDWVRREGIEPSRHGRITPAYQSIIVFRAHGDRVRGRRQRLALPDGAGLRDSRARLLATEQAIGVSKPGHGSLPSTLGAPAGAGALHQPRRRAGAAAEGSLVVQVVR